MRSRRLALVALPLVLLAACSSGKDAAPLPPPPSFDQAPATTIPATPVVANVLSPEAGTVAGTGGKGMVVVLTFTAVDPAALPAQFRLGGDLPGTPAKAGHNPAFPGLVVGTTVTPASLGGPGANLANLFQIVSPARQPDGSIQVTAVWTNAQVSFGADVDVTVGALTVSGPAPDVIPQPLTQLSINSNVASSTFRLAAGDATPAAGAATTTSTAQRTTTTTRRPSTSTTTRPGTGTTTVGPTTTTTRATTTTSPGRATTSTTKLLGLF